MKKFVVIGGGTGTYTVLRGLRAYPLDLTAIVSMMDSGGSNRILRDEFGILPTSDIRQCMIALADESQNQIIRDLFNYRFTQGVGIAGMTFGNLFMAALADMYGSQKDAIEKTCAFLKIKGSILPVTYDSVHLIARYENGRELLGEHFIDEPSVNNGKIVELSTVPQARANDEAVEAILHADYLLLGPGDLYTSTIANLVVDGIRDAVVKSKAQILFIVNLMTKFGQTTGLTAKGHVAVLEKYLGRGIDIVFINQPFKLAPELQARYKEESATVVENDLTPGATQLVVEGDFLSSSVYKKAKSDKLKRSIVRHDSDKLARAIISSCEIAFSAK